MRAALRQAQGGRVYLRYVANQARRRGPKPPPRHGPSDKVEPLPTIALPPILAEARTRWDGGRIGSLQARRGAGLATPYSRFERLTSRMPPALPGGLPIPRGIVRGSPPRHKLPCRARTAAVACTQRHAHSSPRGACTTPATFQGAQRDSKGNRVPRGVDSGALYQNHVAPQRHLDDKRCLPRWRPITAASSILSVAKCNDHITIGIKLAYCDGPKASPQCVFGR